jgi:hypothetical protein
MHASAHSITKTQLQANQKAAKEAKAKAAEDKKTYYRNLLGQNSGKKAGNFGSCYKIRSRTVSSLVAEYLVGGFMR